MANVDRNAEDTTSEEETSEYGTEENSIDDSATQLDSRPGTPGKEVSSTPPPDEVSPTAIFTEQNTGIEETLAPVKESEKEDSSSKNLNMGEAGSSVVQKLSYPKKHPSTIAMIRDAVESLGDKKGSTSLAIKKYVIGLHPDLNNSRFKTQFKRAFMKCIENGLLLRTKATQEAEGLKGRVVLASSKTVSKRIANGAKTELKHKHKHGGDSTSKPEDDDTRMATSKTTKKPPMKLDKKSGGTKKGRVEKTASPKPRYGLSGDSAQEKPKKGRRIDQSESSTSREKVSKIKKTSKDEVPKHEARTGEAPRQAVPKEKAPKEKAPKEKVSKEKTLKKKASKGKAPKEKAPGEKEPKEKAPREKAPKEKAPHKIVGKDKPTKVKVAKEKPAKNKEEKDKGTKALQMQPESSEAKPARGKGIKKTRKA